MSVCLLTYTMLLIYVNYISVKLENQKFWNTYENTGLFMVWKVYPLIDVFSHCYIFECESNMVILNLMMKANNMY